MTTESVVDINGILDRLGIPASVKDQDLDWVRRVMAEAWQFGYTTGIRDYVKQDLSTLAAIEASAQERL